MESLPRSHLWNTSTGPLAHIPQHGDRQWGTNWHKKDWGTHEYFNTSTDTLKVSSEGRERKSITQLQESVLCSVQEYLFLTCLTCRPWLHILSKRSHRLAIRVFSSTPVIFTSPWPSSTASRPIFSTNILLVSKRTKQKRVKPLPGISKITYTF